VAAEKNRRLGYSVAGGASVLLIVIYCIAQSWGSLLGPVTDVIFVVISGSCALMAFEVVRRTGLKGNFGIVYGGFFLCVFLWFLGETTWAVYGVLLGIEIPYPSVADVFYMFGYLPAFVGSIKFLSVFGTGMGKRKIFGIVTLGVVAIIAVLTFLSMPLAVAETNFFASFLDVAYPSFDVILIVLGICMLFTFRGGKVGIPWQWITLGLLLLAIYDIAFSFGTLQGWYYSGHPVEIVYGLGYISLALGFYGQILAVEPE